MAARNESSHARRSAVTTPGRAAGAPTPHRGVSASNPTAHPAGAAAPRHAAPAPQPTARTVSPDAAVPAVYHPRPSDRDPGWGQAHYLTEAHYVPFWTPRDHWYGRDTGIGLCARYGLIDERGLNAGRWLPKCDRCVQDGAPLPEEEATGDPGA